MNKLSASTQYNDWQGSVAFDDGDFKSLSGLARDKSLIGSQENVFGAKAFYLSVSNEFSVTLYYSDKSFDELTATDIALKTVEFELSVSDFFNVFKRADFAFSRKGIMN